MEDVIIKAVKSFNLKQHHEHIYANPNELIRAGFPASFLLPLIQIFQSTEGYNYFCEGEFVDEMVGISHRSVVYALGKYLGVPADTGAGLTGRGFAMQAVVDAIQQKLKT